MADPAITHPFVSEKADSADPTIASSSEWNDEHDFNVDSGTLVGRETQSPARGPAERIAINAPVKLDADGLGLEAGLAPVALTFASGGTTAWDVVAAPNATLALAGGNTTMGAPSGVVEGAYYALRAVQDFDAARYCVERRLSLGRRHRWRADDFTRPRCR